jgi:O-antigen biosynthesis protein
VSRNGPSPGCRDHFRVDGKFLARGRERCRAQGVTYGPFAPNAQGEQFPTPNRVSDDFARMAAAGINSVRTYLLPPEWFLGLADHRGLGVFVDVPWSRHLCFLDSRRAQAEARRLVRRAAEQGRDHPCLLAYGIGNEIPPDVVRWHGVRRVERFIRELADVARQADPGALVTYASYPPTEYLDLSFLDFLTFNVYLHDRETFRRYLFRLQNLAGDKPLVLGELGMDSFRHGEAGQAGFLVGHVCEAILAGVAGLFVFSWTDDWFTGGYQIEDWAFGITRADRTPKESCAALEKVFRVSPPSLLARTPRVSVVVCTYNGGKTLEQCLRSLQALDYPDYEVIVVDDGSTDDTGEILARFPGVRSVRQSNQGLSYARNVGLRLATGEVVAYTDSDCLADPDWLTLLVDQLERTGAAAVGGPNLTPEDGWLASCVAASPGQPTHVLESEQVAEHIPGCNMAFRREVLEEIHGFDSQYRKAGDDVDVCWRLQQAGYWITFAPGAFVWHHRRQTVRAYLKQQAGYGEAEALLRFKHPDRFNGRGDGKWRGVLYGASLQGLRLGKPIVYHGTFGTGMFQCVYQPGPAHWAMLASTLEWHVGVLVAALIALFWTPAVFLACGMMLLPPLVAVLQARQARLAPGHDGFLSRCLIAGLCYLQPLVRSWARYRTRLLAHRPPRPDPALDRLRQPMLSLTGTNRVAYWSENGIERTELVGLVIAYLHEYGWGKAIDSGWSDWDVEVYCHPWTILRVSTAEEEHGAGKRLIRVRFQMRAAEYTVALASACVILLLGAALLRNVYLAVGSGLLLSMLWVLIRFCGAWRGARVAAIVDLMAQRLELTRCEPAARLAVRPVPETLSVNGTAEPGPTPNHPAPMKQTPCPGQTRAGLAHRPQANGTGSGQPDSASARVSGPKPLGAPQGGAE